MGRKKRDCRYFDKDAPKTGVIQFRINASERVNLERMTNKLGISKAELFRRAMSEYYKTVFSDE